MMNEQRKRRYDAFERMIEIPMMALSALFLVLVLLIEIGQFAAGVNEILESLLLLIWGVFALELVIKLALAPDRFRYLLTHIPDILIVLLPFLRPLRFLRAIVSLARFWRQLRIVLRRQTLSFIGLASLTMISASALLVFAVERHSGGPIKSLPDAIWWAITTITTVGYGDMYPVTAFGRGVAVFLMLTGITLFGLLTAHVAAFFVQEEQVDETTADRHEAREVMARLDRIEQELQELRRERRE
ncbi:MAG TPA: potassium channel family protein [Roseiflexaceae bacterium]|nr:potassium channel family protein [Roseiflexaceae bacterium]